MVERHHAVELSSDNRIAVIGERIFILTDYQGPDSYEIDTVLEHGRLKALGKTFKVALSNLGPDLHAELQTYLDEQMARQQGLLPAWNDENADVIAGRAAAHAAVTAEIDSSNAAYLASGEYAASQHATALADEVWATTYVYLRNDTGSEFVAMTERGNSPRISAGSDESWFCSQGPIHMAHVDDSSNWTKGVLLFDAEDVPCSGELLVSEL